MKTARKEANLFSMKIIIFKMAVMLSLNALSQAVGLERFKRSDGDMKYIIFDKLDDAVSVYESVIEENGFFKGDIVSEFNSDEEVLLSSTIKHTDGTATLFFVTKIPRDKFRLEAFTISTDKKVNVRESSVVGGGIFVYYFDPEEWK